MPPEPDIAHSRIDDRALRALVEAVHTKIGEQYFLSLIENLSTALQCSHAYIAELRREDGTFCTCAAWTRGISADKFEIPVTGTHCEAALRGEAGFYREGMQQLFPQDELVRRWGVVSYAGVPLLSSAGRCVGHLAIFYDRPMVNGRAEIDLLRNFAPRAAAEVERFQSEVLVRASEDRLVRVLDSAPDAIVTFNGSMRIEVFNRTAETIFQCLRSVAVGSTLDRFLTDGSWHALEASLADLGRSADANPCVQVPTGLMGLRSDGFQFPIDAWISYAEAPRERLYTLRIRGIEGGGGVDQEIRSASRRSEYLHQRVAAVDKFEEIIGQSPALHAALDQVNLVAATDCTVLLIGETGTGKELVARAIHSRSLRKNGPMIKVNCAALPAGFVDSRLFGHEKGAFTGAEKLRIGRFELANSGSILLDEIGDMSADAQAKLLRVLQEHEVERLGGHSAFKVDVRVIAATNCDLQERVARGSFREDLYYRLSVFPLRVPPLRERKEDIPLLLHYFLGRYASKIGRKIVHVPDHVMCRLMEYSWPGNVRELENVVERAVIVSRGSDLQLSTGCLSPVVISALTNDSFLASRKASVGSYQNGKNESTSMAEIERGHIVATLERAGWRIEGANGAARALNLKPSTLRSRMKKFGIHRSRA